MVSDKSLRIKWKNRFKTWLHGWDKKSPGKCIAAHGTADYSDEHADTLTRKELYKYFSSQDVWASANVNKKINFSSSSNWENFGNLRQILSYIIFLSVRLMVHAVIKCNSFSTQLHYLHRRSFTGVRGLVYRPRSICRIWELVLSWAMAWG